MPMSLLDHWVKTYIGLDVEKELAEDIEWLNAKTSRRKTRVGIRAHIVGWLNRSNDRGQYQSPQTRSIFASENKISEDFSTIAKGEK